MKLTFIPRLLFAPTTPTPGGLDPASAQELAKAMKELDSDVDYFYDSLRNVTRELTGQTDISKDIANNYKQLSKIADQLKYDQEDISKLNKKDLESLVKKLAIQKQSLTQNVAAAKAREAELKSLSSLNAKQAKELASINAALIESDGIVRDQEDGLKKLIAIAQERLELEEKIELKMKVGAGILKTIGKIPIIGGIMDANKGLKAMEDSAKNNENVFKSFGKGISAAFEGISKSTVILAIVDAVYKVIKFIVELMFEADKEVTELARGFMISKSSAAGLREELIGITDEINGGNAKLARLPENMVLLRKETVEANLKLAETTGLTARFNDQLISQFAVINKAMKLQEDEQKGILALHFQTGDQVQTIEERAVGAAEAYKAQSGYQINSRKVLKEVLTTSNALKLSIKGGSEALTQSVINAQHLGISLQKSEDIAEGMLNFESSIQSQLEAELLTGREINLNKLRYAALTGDQVMMTEELNKLVTAAGPDFEKNVLAQQAVAKALGVSRAELADMVTQQKMLNATRGAYVKLSTNELEDIAKKAGLVGDLKTKFLTAQFEGKALYTTLVAAGKTSDEIVKLLGQQATDAYASQTAQEKFNESLEKAKELFANLVSNGFLEEFANAIIKLTKLITGKTDEEIKASNQARNLLSNAATSGDKAKITGLQETATGGVGWVKTAILSSFAGLAGIVPALAYKFSKDSEASSAQEELNKMSTAPTKANAKDFTLNTLPEDTITVQGGTKLGRTDEMVAELKEQNRILMAILAKDTTIKVDGQTLANTVGVNVPVSYGNLLNPGSSTYYS
jgi:hypothetical protein